MPMEDLGIHGHDRIDIGGFFPPIVEEQKRTAAPAEMSQLPAAWHAEIERRVRAQPAGNLFIEQRMNFSFHGNGIAVFSNLEKSGAAGSRPPHPIPVRVACDFQVSSS